MASPEQPSEDKTAAEIVAEEQQMRIKSTLDPKKVGTLLREHFANITPEEFIGNVRKYCPDILDP